MKLQIFVFQLRDQINKFMRHMAVKHLSLNMLI